MDVAGEARVWAERRLVLCSRQLARAGDAALRARLAKAQTAVAALNVQGLLAVHYTERVQERPLRRYGSRPVTVHVERHMRVAAVVARRAVAVAVRRLGWRVYATNAPADQLPLPQAVLAYRSEYLIERSFGRLKGRPWSLTPMYLAREDHATGLIRLLTIGLRVLTLMEFAVRCRLAATGTQLAGLYAGNPKRTTAQPTAERLLEAFQELTPTIIRQGPHQHYHLTALSTVHRWIIALPELPMDIYTRLYDDSHKPP